VFITPDVEEVKSEFSVEIFELNKHTGPTFLDSFHELGDKLSCLGI
jgi:hypothetical protein